MKLPIALRFRGRSSATERGPSARRGLRFANASLPELMAALAGAQATLRRMDTLDSSHDNSTETQRLRNLSAEERERLRKDNIALQSDLRAELRRRGAY